MRTAEAVCQGVVVSVGGRDWLTDVPAGRCVLGHFASSAVTLVESGFRVRPLARGAATAATVSTAVPAVPAVRRSLWNSGNVDGHRDGVGF